MDVNTIHVNQLTTEEKDKCIKEGCCFRCQKQGYRSKECPLKKAANATAQFVAQTQCAHVRTNKVVDDRDSEADDAKLVMTDTTTFLRMDTICNLQALKEEERL